MAVKSDQTCVEAMTLLTSHQMLCLDEERELVNDISRSNDENRIFQDFSEEFHCCLKVLWPHKVLVVGHQGGLVVCSPVVQTHKGRQGET